METQFMVDLTPSRESWPHIVRLFQDAVEAHKRNIKELGDFAMYYDGGTLPSIVEEAIEEKISKLQASIIELEHELVQPWALSVIEAE